MKQVGRVVSFMENDNKNLAYFQHIKKIHKKVSNVKVFKVDPYFGCTFQVGLPKKGCTDFPLLSEVFHNPLVSLARLRLAFSPLQGSWLVLRQQKE